MRIWNHSTPPPRQPVHIHEEEHCLPQGQRGECEECSLNVTQVELDDRLIQKEKAAQLTIEDENLWEERRKQEKFSKKQSNFLSHQRASQGEGKTSKPAGGDHEAGKPSMASSRS